MVRNFGAMVIAATLVVPTLTYAYFPPIRPVTVVGTPDPFPIPDTGVVGEPEAPDPGDKPTAATPEPATLAMGLIGLAAVAGLRMRKQRVVSA
jgi:PEP-CTERM motif